MVKKALNPVLIFLFGFHGSLLCRNDKDGNFKASFTDYSNTCFAKEVRSIYPIISKARIFKYALPLRYQLPLKSTCLNTRDGLIIELTDQAGNVAYGESAPLPDFSHESLAQVENELPDLLRTLLFRSVSDDELAHLFQNAPPSVSFAIESALWGFGVQEWQSIPQTAPLLLGGIDQIQRRLSDWQGSWPDEFKLKVARGSIDNDKEIVTAVLSLLPEQIRLRLDANGRWMLPEAFEFHRLLVSKSAGGNDDILKRIAYIEEPTVSHEEFSEFYRQTGIGYALDESIQHGNSVNISAFQGLKALVIKPMLTGSLHRCRQLANEANAVGARVVLSSSFESMVGIHCLQQLSTHWFPEELAGLDTASAFADNIIDRMPDPGCPLPEDIVRNKMELVWEASRT